MPTMTCDLPKTWPRAPRWRLRTRKAYEQLDGANRLKDEFLGTLSHELRTPLNAVLGYARMVRAGTLSGDRAVQAMEVIERNAASSH